MGKKRTNGDYSPEIKNVTVRDRNLPTRLKPGGNGKNRWGLFSYPRCENGWKRVNKPHPFCSKPTLNPLWDIPVALLRCLSESGIDRIAHPELCAGINNWKREEQSAQSSSHLSEPHGNSPMVALFHHPTVKRVVGGSSLPGHSTLIGWPKERWPLCAT